MAGARVQLFLRNMGPAEAAPLHLSGETAIKMDGRSPGALIESGAWAWHDTPSATPDRSYSLAPGALTVWSFNSRESPFGLGDQVSFQVGPPESPWLSEAIEFPRPRIWISSVTFLALEKEVRPDRIVVHLANDSDSTVEIQSCRLWLPPDPKSPHVLLPQPSSEALAAFGNGGRIPSGDKSGFVLATASLPLTYCALELRLKGPEGIEFSLWAYLRIKVERFDISGGWVNGSGNTVANPVFLKTLKRLHVDTAHLANTPGYTDTDLYTQYPLKYVNKLTPFEVYDTDEMLPRIHAVEFLGEPQYGGGTPVAPQEVWSALLPYASTRLPTSITHSEERIWRDYAGLSDFPHYDAYRVSAPSPDAWGKYDRWPQKRIGWGAPLETIGDMCRSLRELNRPMPCAYWSQGPHAGWGHYGGRERTSPTPDEIRLQAYHAIATRITSLYWFNLSVDSLVKWRDTLDELGRIGREIRMLDEFILEGDAFQFKRLKTVNGELDWDIASIFGPRAGLLFALDLAYEPDYSKKVFMFGEPRPATWSFRIPAYMEKIESVFRVDSEGVYNVSWKLEGEILTLEDAISRVGIYVITPNEDLRNTIEIKRQSLVEMEDALSFDPATNDTDFALLSALTKEQ